MRKWAVLAVLGFLAQLGCTRGAGKGTSVQLSFSSTDLASMSTDLGTVIINVSGGNIPAPILYQWDRHGCDTGCTVPSQFVIPNIPTGNNVLIQVLAVYEDSDSEALTFKYADALRSLTSGDVVVEVAPVQIGTSKTQGHIYARLLNLGTGAAPTGPTGVVEARFRPPAWASVTPSPPPLTVMRSPVFAGWMNLFALDGDAKLDYFLNGSPLFADLNIQSMATLVGTGFAMIDIPDYERPRYTNGTAGGLQIEPAQKLFFGYFGPLVGTRRACYSSSDGLSITDASVAGSGGATALLWNGSAHDATKVSPEAGGYAYSAGDSVCDDTPTKFDSHLVFNYANLRNGHDSVIGFRGPFRAVTPYGDYVNALTLGSGLVRLEVEMLPGTAGAAGVVALRVLRRPATGTDDGLYGSGDGIQCSVLEKNGFTSMGDFTLSEGQGAVSMTIGGLASPASFDFVVCPLLAAGPVDGGVKVNSFRQPPVFKILGSNTSLSLTGGPGIVPGMQLLKSAFTNNFHNIAVMANGQFANTSHIQDAQVSIDGGAWTSINKSSAVYGGVSMAVLPVPSTALNVNSSSKTIRFRVNLSSSGITALGQENAVMTSELIRLVGSAECASPGTLQAFDLDAQAFVTDASLLNLSSSQVHRFQMRWNGCAQAAAPLDYVSISGSMSPAGCFSTNDINRPDALTIEVDPKDLLLSDCSMAGTTVYFRAPSNAGTDAITAPGSTITHSLTAAGLVIYATAHAITSLADLTYLYDLVTLGSSVNFKAAAMKANQDGGAIGIGGTAVATPNWSAPVNVTSAISAGNLLDMTTVASPSQLAVRSLTAQEGTLLGNFGYYAQTYGSVIHATENSVDEGTAVFLVDNGTADKLMYVPPNAAKGFVGQVPVTLNWPADIPAITGSTVAKIFYVTQLNRKYLYLAIQGSGANAAKSYFTYGEFVYTSSGPGVVWSTAVVWNGTPLVDAHVGYFSGTYRPVALRMNGSVPEAVFGDFPTRSVSTWSGPINFGSSPTDMSAYGMASFIGFAQCGSDMFIAGRAPTSNYLAYGRFDVSSGGFASIGSASLDVSAMNRLSCADIGPTSEARMLVAYNPTTSAAKMVAFEGLNASCGGSSYSNLSVSGSLTPLTPSSGGYVKVLNTAQGLSFIFESSTGVTAVKAVQVSCSSGVVSVNASTPKITAEINAASSTLNGASMLQGLGAAGLIIYGNNAQYYQMRSR